MGREGQLMSTRAPVTGVAERGQRAGPSKLVRNPGLGPTSSRSHYGVLKAGT